MVNGECLGDLGAPHVKGSVSLMMNEGTRIGTICEERDASPLTGAPDPAGATGRSGAPRPAPHLTHRPRPESRPAPRRYRRVALAWAVLACVLALATPALAQTMVPADWGLKPTGLADGAKFRLLFLSSTGRNAIATDIVDYNTFVQDRAAAGHADIQGYSAGFRAVGCTTAVDARNNTGTTDNCAGGTTTTCSVSPAEAQGSVRDRHL